MSSYDQKCRVCGCSEDRACWPPCSWVKGQGDICSTCNDAVRSLQEYFAAALFYRPGALMTEVKARMKVAAGGRPERLTRPKLKSAKPADLAKTAVAAVLALGIRAGL